MKHSLNMKFKLGISLIPLLFFVASCGVTSNESGRFKVHFDTCIELETNYLEDQYVSKDSLIEEPTVIVYSNPNYDKKISGWYTDKAYSTLWDFEVNKVVSDTTLYAKWVGIITLEYYLKGSDKPIWTVPDALEGEPVQRHDELCDGYDFFGYFADPECSIPFDLEAPLNEDTKIYMLRSSTMSFNPRSIKRRFTMHAAGGSGSRVGSISDVGIDQNGDEYVDVNFGYSTSADPYMIITNPQIDISKSQKIKMKFKNFGGSTSLAFYWVSKYEDGGYASGYQFDSEANAAHYSLNSYECYMDENDPWLEKEFDLSSVFTNGISPWANSTTLVHLRIQFGYISLSQNDLSNVIRFNSITSVSDETNVGFNDSTAIKNMLADDSGERIAAASSAQTQNRGVIFPKNFDSITETTSEYFRKENGLLLYSHYGDDIKRYNFDVSSQEIDAERFSYLTIRLRNYSYVSSLTLYVTTINPTSGRSINTISSVPISTRMQSFDDISVNLYGRENMIGKIKSLSIRFNYNGVDNAILIGSITLSETRSFQVPGFNFDDSGFAGFVGNEQVALSYEKEAKSTVFTTSTSNASISFTPDYSFDTTAYYQIALNHSLGQGNITSLTIKITIDGVTSSYVFSDLSSEMKEATQVLEKVGVIERIEIEFNGIGKIYISSIEFLLRPETSVDFSTSSTYASTPVDWSAVLSYQEDKRATLYKDGSDMFRYYLGYLYDIGRRQYPNISLKDKSYIYIIYQNQKSFGSLRARFYGVNSDTEADYLTAFNESSPIIEVGNIGLQKNMNENSWAVYAIPIPSAYTGGNYYLSNLGIASEGNQDISLYIRGITVI